MAKRLSYLEVSKFLGWVPSLFIFLLVQRPDDTEGLANVVVIESAKDGVCLRSSIALKTFAPSTRGDPRRFLSQPLPFTSTPPLSCESGRLSYPP